MLAGVLAAMIAASARSRAAGNLYRGALIRLVDDHGLAIPESATEYECVALVRARDVLEPAGVFGDLTDAWIGARYAAAPPDQEHFEVLCVRFDRAFGVAA